METTYSQDESGQWWAYEYHKDGSIRQRSRCKARKCAQCDEEFVRLYANKYCSRTCTNRAKADQQIAQRVQQVCKQCGEEFWNRHPQQFCSSKCQHVWETGRHKKVEPPRICPICGSMFERKIRRPWRKTCGNTKCVRALADQHPGYLSGPDHPNWSGGARYQTEAGYVMVYAGIGMESRLEHRVVMEQIIGRPLQRYEEVHHRNAIRSDNRPENLELWVKRQPGGGRIKDLIAYARWILETYEPLEDKL